jgi:hypothetical protein
MERGSVNLEQDFILTISLRYFLLEWGPCLRHERDLVSEIEADLGVSRVFRVGDKNFLSWYPKEYHVR